MKLINLMVLIGLGAVAFAQDVRFDYDRAANFSAYKTYNWIDYRRVDPGDQLLDQDIKRAVDAQLSGKGLRRSECGGDLVVGYQAGISQEKEFDNIGAGGRGGPFGWGNTRVMTSTIDIGRLTVGLFDPAKKQLVWRGAASKTLNISKDPDKNYCTLEKGVANLFKNYPQARESDKRTSFIILTAHMFLNAAAFSALYRRRTEIVVQSRLDGMAVSAEC